MESVNDFYKKRIADKLLDEALDTTGAVLIEGAKWCGKTTTGLRHAKSVIRIDDPAEIERNIMMSKLNPTLLLDGATPRLVDEWQLALKLWDAARYAIDSRRKNGQFIFTGSSTPVESKEITHSGAGRFSFVLMRTMSLFESGDSNGSISLGDMLDGKK